VLFLLLLFVFRHLLLFVLFFVFLAALVSHACSFQRLLLEVWITAPPVIATIIALRKSHRSRTPLPPVFAHTVLFYASALRAPYSPAR
jgi:hypothetical protein